MQKTPTGPLPKITDPNVAALAREVEALNHRLARLDWLAYTCLILAVGIFLMCTFSLTMHSIGIW